MFDLNGTRAVITGAANGIGRAIAELVVQRGASVVATDINAEELRDAFEGADNVTTIVGDIASDATHQAILDAAEKNLGGLDILVNNAGIFRRATIEAMEEADWDAVMAANIKSVQFCTKYAIPALWEARGNVINIASESGLNGYPETTAYCASKGAVVNLTRAMAMELAPEIRVNALCPGYIKTSINEDYWDTDLGKAELAKLPRSRVGVPADLDSALLFLVDPRSHFVNGEALTVDDAQSWAI